MSYKQKPFSPFYFMNQDKRISHMTLWHGIRSTDEGLHLNAHYDEHGRAHEHKSIAFGLDPYSRGYLDSLYTVEVEPGGDVDAGMLDAFERRANVDSLRSLGFIQQRRPGLSDSLTLKGIEAVEEMRKHFRNNSTMTQKEADELDLGKWWKYETHSDF